MPPTPASMFLMKSMCPGTSMTPTGSPGVPAGSVVRRRQSQPGKTQVDRHLALFFLAQAIRVNAGQGVHQGRLAVIDVAGGADHAHRASGRRQPSL